MKPDPHPNHIESAEVLRQQAITECISLENWLQDKMEDVKTLRRLLEGSTKYTETQEQHKK